MSTKIYILVVLLHVKAETGCIRYGQKGVFGCVSFALSLRIEHRRRPPKIL